jgi:hypothetical protein
MLRWTTLFLLIPTLAFAQSRPTYRIVHDPHEIADVTHEFAKSYRENLGLEAKIRNCTHMVDHSAGVKDGQHSLGAVCEVKIGRKQEMIMLCNDDMVGFFVQSMSYNIAHNYVDNDFVAKFATQNCSGG